MEALKSLPSNYSYFLYGVGSIILYKIAKACKNYYYKRSRHNELVKQGALILEKRNKEVKDFYNKYKDEVSKDDIEKIVKLSVYELAEAIRNKEITSRKATLVYLLNCATVGLELNGMADADFERSLMEAVKADELIGSKSKNELPALVGLPMTIKDHVPVKGYLDTIGFCAQTKNVSDLNCDVVENLRKLGVVVICKSNVIQATMGAETTSKVYGTSKNIYNFKRTTGGSSGGEGCLIGAFCSPLGIGTDIAGSIRNPGAFNGIYGFKPTSNKLSVNKIKNIDGGFYDAWNIWPCSSGFLSKDLSGILLLSQQLFGSFEDHETDQRKFNLTEFNSTRKIKVGYSFSHKGFEVHSSIKESITRIIEKVKEKKLPYEFVEFDIENFVDFYKKGMNLVLNGSTLYNARIGADGEDLLDSYQDLVDLTESPMILVRFIRHYYKYFTKENRNVEFIDDYERYENLDQFWKDGQIFYKLRDEFYKWAKESNIEAFILPTYPIPAPLIGNSLITNSTVFYLIIISMLNLPSISIPTELNNDEVYKTVFKDKLAELMIDDVKSSKGMPLSMQIAALPGQDEIVLRIAKDCSDIINFKYNDITVKCDKTENFWKLRNVEK